MIFEDLPTTPTAEELVDKAFSRAARTGRAKSGREGQESMLRTAGNILSDNLENVVTAWPDFAYEVSPFYYELADALVDVDAVRQSLNEVHWAADQIASIRDEYTSKLRKTDEETARKHRKQAFARFADIVEEVDADLDRLGTARDELKLLPDVDPEEPVIAVAGYPNVGKSAFVNAVTRASNETASYPFTTTGIQVGHFDRDHVRYQLIDTPGLLDRPADERNEVEQQAVSALAHAADAVLFLVDASGNCGYPLDVQLDLRDAVAATFDVPVLTICNKSDLSTDVEAEAYMSVTADENVDDVLERAAVAVGYEPDLPSREGDRA
ncbi:NOG1 family protein [Halobaculum sp. MBLA0147]|uniref:NOG1 family protein n=1 Tax=Halobaculum sp. MBLA0147 TaxID=3079934 RepID=UPI003526606C